MQVRLERVWGILQMPVTAKLDWVIRYTGPEAADMFEPALQAFEQAAAAVLERERCPLLVPLLAACHFWLYPSSVTHLPVHLPTKTSSGSRFNSTTACFNGKSVPDTLLTGLDTVPYPR